MTKTSTDPRCDPSPRQAQALEKRLHQAVQAVGVAFALALSTAGCPIPIAHTDALSPPLVGLFRQSDDTPIAGARVAVSIEYDDSACARPTQQTTTDAAGAFRLPSTEKRYSVNWLVPLFDRVDPAYRVCLSVGDTLQTAFVGHGSLSPPAPLDSISCVEWTWDDRTRVTCSGFGRREQTLSAGGRWTDGESNGWYRLILTEGLKRVPGYRVPVRRPRAYVQWMEENSDGSRSVRKIAELPIDPKVTALWEIVLLERYRKWHASLRGIKPKFMSDFAATHLMFAIGKPGEVRPVDPW